MTFEERSTWIYATVALFSFVAYAAVIAGRAQGVPLHEVAYVAPMLWTIGGGILVTIAGNILVANIWRGDCGKKDVRDLEIGRFGERVGQSFICIGGVAALVLAMAKADHFWIAHTIYVGFAASTLLAAATKLVAYRRGIPDC